MGNISNYHINTCVCYICICVLLFVLYSYKIYDKQFGYEKEQNGNKKEKINFTPCQFSLKFHYEMFNPRRRSISKKQKIIISVAAVILIYLFFFGRYQTYEQSEIIKNAKPIEVWEFVADFSKMKELNPTILDFKILSDHGNNEDWKYTVEFLEKLSHWPYWENTINGNFHVRKVLKDSKNLYLVESTHKVCFFKFFCRKYFNLNF